MHAWTKVTAHFTILIGRSNFVGRFCNSFRKLGHDYVTSVIQLIVLVLEYSKKKSHIINCTHSYWLKDENSPLSSACLPLPSSAVTHSALYFPKYQKRKFFS